MKSEILCILYKLHMWRATTRYAVIRRNETWNLEGDLKKNNNNRKDYLKGFVLIGFPGGDG